MTSNPLSGIQSQLAIAGRGIARGVIDWAFGRMPGQGTAWGLPCKSDPIIQQKTLDELRRAAYNSDFDNLFTGGDEFPFVVPDKTLKQVIKGKLADNIFPKGTKFTIDNEAAQEVLSEILDRCRFRLKCESLVEESALMGYSGLRTVYDSILQRWVMEVKPKEFLRVETPEGIPDEIVAIRVLWPVMIELDGKPVRHWQQERWTNEVYQKWAPKPEELGKIPEFKPEDAQTEDNVYQEIPITLIPHMYDENEFGVGVVGIEEVLNVKALIRLKHKRHYGHQKYMDPNPVRSNSDSKDPLVMGIGNVIDIQSSDASLPVDLKLLEFAGMPESVQNEFDDLVSSLYRAANLKPPPPDNQPDKTGTASAGVALRMLDKDDCKEFESLRDGGYSNVVRHLEKVLRMGKALGLPQYGFVTEDPKSYAITTSFPDFFPPQDSDIALKIANMQAAQLPPRLQAPRIAALFGIEDEDDIKEIEAALQEHKEMMEPQNLEEGNGFN